MQFRHSDDNSLQAFGDGFPDHQVNVYKYGNGHGG